ncbi:hypothetical protein DRH29_03860 [candidate division Kazan bacterium]|uniref:Serine protease n=1 Tax=candidate division Kazan bacterium TaxID=2202143 RepID=A0A420ZBX6_UNCK3|nr:MAG: hypothetical protein DRH29_03860 [candidate division Kazan bacterium]
MKTKIREVIEKHGKDLLKYPNVIGFSNLPQKRIRRGKVVDELVLRVYVTRKVPEHLLRKDEVIPKEIEGVRTDVVEIGRIKKLQGYRERYRPAPCGVSTSRADQNAAGTIGWFMVDEDGNIYLLSNNHVWANENNASQGDPLIQPGLLDGGDPEQDIIAELYDWINIDFTGNPNTVDAALATPIDLSQVYMSIMEIGGITGKGDPALNVIAKKVGRSTGYSEGTIIDVNATLNVEYDSGTALFQDVFIVQSDNVIVQPGDSGSPILDGEGRFIGLLFAGNEEGTTFVGCKASNIEAEFQNKLGKKIWILLANAYPPFHKEVVYEVQKVYPSSLEVMGLSLQMIMQFMVFTAMIGFVNLITKEAVKIEW